MGAKLARPSTRNPQLLPLDSGFQCLNLDVRDRSDSEVLQKFKASTLIEKIVMVRTMRLGESASLRTHCKNSWRQFSQKYFALVLGSSPDVDNWKKVYSKQPMVTSLKEIGLFA